MCQYGGLASGVSMADDGVAGMSTEESSSSASPAIARSSRRFSLFQSSRRSYASSCDRSASNFDFATPSTCLGLSSFRDALFSEHPDGGGEERKGSSSRWWRFGFGSKKNRVREELEEVAPPKESKKARMEEPQHKWSHCESVSPVLERKKPEVRELSSDFVVQTRKKPRCEPEVLVAQLRSKRGEEQGVVADEVRVLAKENPTARVTLGGAIAPLVAMLDTPSVAHTALATLHTLASGNDVNKAAIVDAGIVPKLLNLLQQNPEPTIQELTLANFLSLSALDRNKPLMGTAIASLLQSLKRNPEAVRALYNLSLWQPNIRFFEDAGAIVDMVDKGRDWAAEKALAVLGNMVGVGVGRKCVTEAMIEVLVGVLGWGSEEQYAKCQERAAYILMVIAHYSYAHRQVMVQKRAIPALLEVSLLGSALAQKRCVRVLECLREDRERPRSAPMGPPPSCRPRGTPTTKDQQSIAEGSKIVNLMVQESLEQNLQRIVRRANFGDGSVTRAFSISGCSSSKSLPF